MLSFTVIESIFPWDALQVLLDNRRSSRCDAAAFLHHKNFVLTVCEDPSFRVHHLSDRTWLLASCNREPPIARSKLGIGVQEFVYQYIPFIECLINALATPSSSIKLSALLPWYYYDWIFGLWINHGFYTTWHVIMQIWMLTEKRRLYYRKVEVISSKIGRTCCSQIFHRFTICCAPAVVIGL